MTAPPAANPSKLLAYGWSQSNQTVITFDSDLDRRLFAVGINKPEGIGVIPAWWLAYEAVAETLKCGSIDCEDFRLARIKGVVSPLAAIIRARREIDADGPLDVRHVRMRVSTTAWSEYDICYVNGNEDGRGGSHDATVIGAPEDVGLYHIEANNIPDCVACRVPGQLAAAWEAFVQEVRGGA